MSIPGGSSSPVSPMQALLAAVNFPPDCVDDAIALLSSAVGWLEFKPREVICEQGQPVRYVYYLVDGSVFQTRTETTASGDRHTLLHRERARGVWLGTYDLLNNQPFSVQTRAIGPCRVLAIRANPLSQLLSLRRHLRGLLVPYKAIGRLRTVPFLSAVDLVTLNILADECGEPRKFHSQDVIYAAGSPADTLYFIDSGQVELDDGQGRRWWVGNGHAIGFLLHDRVRQRGAVAAYDHQARVSWDCVAYPVSRRKFTDIVGLDPERTGHRLLQECAQTLGELGVFSRLTDEEKRRLLGYCSYYHMPAWRPLLRSRQLGDSMWILMPERMALVGQAGAEGGRQPTAIRGPAVFNEPALLLRQIMDFNLDAETHSQWLRIHWGDSQVYLRDLHQQAPDLADRLVLDPATRRTLAKGKKTKIQKRLHWLQADENVDQIQRRHWIALFPKLRPALILGLILVPVAALLTLFAIDNAIAQGLVWALVAISTAALAAWGLWDYWNDFVVLTNQRLIHQEKIPFIRELHQEAPLERVQDSATDYTFWAKVLRYGHLTVQTAATAGAIQFTYLPKPKELGDRLKELTANREAFQRRDDIELATDLLEKEMGLVVDYPERVTDDPPSPKPSRRWRFRSRSGSADGAQPRPAESELPHYVWRKHWFILVKRIFWPALLLLLTMGFLVAELTTGFLDPFPTMANALRLLAVAVGLGLMCWLAWDITDWYNDTYELTADSIIDVEKKPLFTSEKRRSATLDRIQNIDFEIPNPLYYLLDLGNVKIQTAATSGDFTFDWVSHPRKVARIIDERRELVRQQVREDTTRKSTSQLQEWVIARERMR